MAAAKDSPPKTSFFARLLRKRAPRIGEYRTEKVPVAEESPTGKIPPGKGGPVRKAPPGKGGPVRKAPPGKGGPVKKAPPAKLWPEKQAPASRGAPAKKAPTAKVSPTKRTRKLPFEPFGPGSARATLDGGGPAGWLVKGRTDTRLYYTPDDPTYDLVVAQVWFRDEQYAARALFTPWCKSSRKH
ncbi:channel accessory protein ArfC, sunset domain variant [Mycobacterium sp.]|uniref:channel accessory protein ArfC, sunset domain variant n=1 Tax=Mycobacterium sp. TaxID=1785 RepID=UPI003F977C4D